MNSVKNVLLGFIFLLYGICSVFAQEKGYSTNNVERLNSLVLSKENLQELQTDLNETVWLTKSWFYIDKMPETPSKLKLIKLQNKIINQSILILDSLSVNWTAENLKIIAVTNKSITNLIYQQKNFVDEFQNIEDYDNMSKVFSSEPIIENGGEIDYLYSEIEENINLLIRNFKKKEVTLIREMLN